MRTSRRTAVSLLSLIAVCTTSTLAAAAPMYTIAKLGFDDLEHTQSDGYKFSRARQLNEAGQAIGESSRYNGDIWLGWSAWLQNGTTAIDIGLAGPEHTRNDGYKSSNSQQLSQDGQVIGTSDRYDGGSSQLGESAWLYNGTATINIGLTGPEHTRSDGFKFSEPIQLNEAGVVLGYSDRYNSGSIELGWSLWLYDGTTTTDIGLTGPEYTRNNGYKLSSASDLNESGQVSGVSYRYNGTNSSWGRSAWLRNGSDTSVIGLTGPEHTKADGYQFNQSRQINEAGQVIGYSDFYNGGSTKLGQSAWLYNGTTTMDIGLTGPEYTGKNGGKWSDIEALNEAGQVIGRSGRYGNTGSGHSAWLYNGSTTINVGLTDAEHTRNDGWKNSFARQLNAAGQVTGSSDRYYGGSIDLGRSAWLYNGLATINIGLVDGEHTQNNGYRLSESEQLNEAGHAIGRSVRYNGGSSAWLYNGTTTIKIGLTGPEHTRSDDRKVSAAYQLNEAGQATGISLRYNGGSTELGQDAWFYDPLLNQTFSLNLSTRGDGYAYSVARYLGEDGLVLGEYGLFDSFDNGVGYRAFWFTAADGLHDLGSLVDGGLTVQGWASLAEAIRANSRGQILGRGKLASQTGGETAYLLTPIIPEPSTFALLALCTPLLTTRLRRPRSRPIAP